MLRSSQKVLYREQQWFSPCEGRTLGFLAPGYDKACGELPTVT